MLLHEALSASDKVDGWLTQKEQTLLYNLAKEVPEGKCIVELGSWMGKSTIMLAAGSMAGSKVPVYAVDYFTVIGAQGKPYDRYLQGGTKDYLTIFTDNIRNAGLSSVVVPIRSSTVTAGETWVGPEPYLLFIDADHRYQAVRKDFLAWIEHCGLGASVAFHDFNLYANPGVFMFVNCLSVTPLLSCSGQVDSIWHGKVAKTNEVPLIKGPLGHCFYFVASLFKLSAKMIRTIIRYGNLRINNL